MKIYKEIIGTGEPMAIALGFFDGLHRGHQSVIKAAAAQKQQGLTSTMLSFAKSPRSLLSEHDIPCLMTHEQKYELLDKLGVEVLYELDFESVRDLSAEDFVAEVLCKQLKAKSLFCGFNYHFGKRGAGDEKRLHELGDKYEVSVYTLPPVLFEGSSISSSRIRESLKNGEIDKVTQMLGRYFSFNFEVSHGNRLGTKMETPTINQYFPESFILPKFGVYATLVNIGGKTYPAVTNIGVKPTVGSERPLSESWIISGDIGSTYGETVNVELVEFLRPEMKFSGIPQLQAAIKSDGERAKNVFERMDIAL